MRHSSRWMALIAVLALVGIVGAGVIACTRVVVIEAGPAPDAPSVPNDNFQFVPDADIDAAPDASIIDASDIDAA